MLDGQSLLYESMTPERDGETASMRPIRPNFERPPIVEQAISVIFDEVAGFTLGDFGLFWSHIRDEFQATEAQPLIEPRIEKFDGYAAARSTIQLVPQETLPRCFYRKDDGTEIVQVQQDRFTFNWTASKDRAYPHSEATVARFCEMFSKFERFIEERGLGALNIVQCEVVNVNIVPVADFGSSFADAGEVFKGASSYEGVEFLSVETYVLNTQHIISHGQGPVGRLYSALTPVIRVEDGAQTYRYQLTARGAPLGDGREGVLKFFDVARNAINGAFLSATTAKAQTLWGKRDG